MHNNRDESRELSHSGEDIGLQPATKPTSLTYIVGAGSDPGKRTTWNEDSILAISSTWNASPPPSSSGLFVLADGMGGYADGQEASCGAIQTMVDHIWPKIVRNNTIQPETCIALLTEAVQLANETVNQKNIHLHNLLDNKANEDDVFVSTTVTAAMIVGSTAYVANVGNSRTYLYRASEGLKQITKDHTIVARLVEDGILQPDEIYTHSKRNQITRSLGAESLVEVDIFTEQLQHGDTLLLCTYSLWEKVHNSRIEDIISRTPPDPPEVAEALIQAALEGRGYYNVSAIVVSIAADMVQGSSILDPFTVSVSSPSTPLQL